MQTAVPNDRAAVRAALLQRRSEWWRSAEAPAARQAMGEALKSLVRQLEPDCLGLYWALDAEFDVAALAIAEGWGKTMRLALPSALKQGRQMDYRLWDGTAPQQRDECGIPCADGAIVQPDVLLVPCVGFSRDAYRIGYGGGYFDRWLARHAGVTTLGLAWAMTELSFEPQAHDQALTMIVTERELIMP